MAMSKKSKSTPTRKTLDRTAVRALALLRAIAIDPSIHAAMTAAGFTSADRERGWALLGAAHQAKEPAPTAVVVENPAPAALAELTAWKRPGFLRARAALRHLHPEQGVFVFQDLDAGADEDPVLAIGAFLDRCDELLHRQGSRKADLAALATLEQRGVTKAERLRLRELINVVKATGEPVPQVAPGVDLGASVELREWVLDWSDTARAVITRRDQLIRMGIGKRHPKTPKPPVAKEPVTGAPPPVVSPPPEDDEGPDSRAA